MSDGAHRLWRQVAPGAALYYRFFSRRRSAFPSEMTEALAALGGRRFDRARARGILLASPLRLGAGEGTWEPDRLAVAFVANDRRGAVELERWFRGRFEA